MKILRICILFMAWIIYPVFLTAQSPSKEGPLGTVVNVISGNLYHERDDMTVFGRGINIEVVFSYNSFLHQVMQNNFGNGWSFKYDIRYYDDTSSGRKIFSWGDGSDISFISDGAGGFKAERGYVDKLSEPETGKFLLIDEEGIKFYFENEVHKKITKIEDLNANNLLFSYSNNQLTGITHSSGLNILLEYDARGLLSSIKDNNASPEKIFKYTYDNDSNLVSVTNPLNEKYEYKYAINGSMSAITDKNKNVLNIIYYPDYTVKELVGCNKRISFSYADIQKSSIVTDHMDDGSKDIITVFTYDESEDQAWITSVKGNCCGFNMKFEYDQFGNIISETDGRGLTTEFRYDSSGRVTAVTDPEGQRTFYTYKDGIDKVASITDPKGNRTQFEYDDNGNLTKLITPQNTELTATYSTSGDITSFTDAKGNIYNYSYNSYGFPVLIEGPENTEIEFDFDDRGNFIEFKDANQNSYNFEYDLLNRLRKINAPGNTIHELNYDANGNITSYKNPANLETFYYHDASDRLVKITDPSGKSIMAEYDPMDNLKSVKKPLGHEEKYEYNFMNEISKFIDPEGNSTELDYDASGNLVSMRMDNGVIYNLTYDNNNRVTRISDNIGDLAIFSYDPAGNLTSYTNAKGGRISATYDKNNRVVSTTDILGNTTRYIYDENNNIISIIDRTGLTHHFSYDGLKRMKTYTDTNGGIYELGYDNAGNVISIKDANNNITTYTYDHLHRRKRMNFHDGSYKEFNYDERGNITSIRDSDGAVTSFAYDELDQVITKTLPGGEIITNDYDDLGRIISVTNSQGTVYLDYDKLDRIISETFNGRKVEYLYNTNGRTSKVKYPDGTEVTREYDFRNRLIKLTGNGETIAEYVYDASDQLIEEKFRNGIKTTYQYDFANRLTRKFSSGAELLTSNFNYDKEGNKTLIKSDSHPQFSEQFSYDNNYRLVNYKRGTGAGTVEHSYSYDNLGNRTSAIINGTSINYTSNNLNQLTSAGGINLNYNNRGEMIYDGKFYKTYDGSGRIIKDSSEAGIVQTYTYDPLGRLIQKSSGTIIQNFTYSGFEQIEVRNQVGELIGKTIYAGMLQPVLLENSQGGFYYHRNNQLSIEGITDATGKLVERYVYDPFGKPMIYDSNYTIIQNSLVGNKMAFTGQEYDQVTESYRFYYRSYSPDLGIFNQRDLIEYEDGMGMYQYVGNNPANGIDIWGLNCTSTSETKKSKGREVYDKLSWGVSMGGFFTQDKFDQGLRKGLRDLGKKMAKGHGKDIGKIGRGMKKFANTKLPGKIPAVGKGLGIVDNVMKGANFLETALDGSPSNPQNTEEWGAGAEFGFSLLGWSGPGAILGLADFTSEKITGESLLKHTENAGNFLGENYANWENGLPIKWQWGKPIDENWRPFWDKDWWTYDYHFRKNKKKKCKEKGTRRRIQHYNPLNGQTYLIWSIDPNEIVGPEGVADPKWVSVDDRMQYTIFCENSELATGPARVVKITTPVEPKHDPTTINLGSFGFNGLEFEIPAGLATYSARLDIRDSLGIYVDVVAGYDPNTNSVFWNFSSIDPVTFLPSTDPAKGVLLLRSDEFEKHGHGFVNFSIKPRRTAETGDTTGARAEIVFDDNEMIPTNIHHNTIDAIAPESNITEFSTTENLVQLRWNGADDPGGSGIATYALYVANDRLNYSLFGNPTTSKDTSFTLAVGQEYCFFVLATDSTGNVEKMMPDGISCLELRGALPVTWLYFEGENIGKDNKLNWATASEQNSKEFLVERSVDGKEYMPIALVPAAGNSSIKTYYEYIDKEIDKLNSVMMYYRLRQIDLDGKYVFSKTITLRYTDIGFEPSIVYPNPTHSFAIIKIGEKSLLKTEAILMDVNGKILERIKIESEYQQVDLSKYLKGMYFIQLANKQVLRVVRQ